jgi:hypothetical protein
MILALFWFFVVGGLYVGYLADTGKTDLQTAGSIVAIELLLVWLLAFACAVRTRPTSTAVFYQYPPVIMLRKGYGFALICGIILGAILGHVIGLGILKSILYSLPGIFFVPIVTHVLFAGTIATTRRAMTTKGDPDIQIANAYRNTWFLSTLALLLICMLLRWIVGKEPGLTPFLATAHGALIAAVVLTGYASGYYP